MVCLWHYHVLQYPINLFKTDIFRKLMIQHWWQSLFLSIPSKNSFLIKKITLNTDSAASSGGQGKLKYVMYLPWLLLEAELSISFVSYFNWCNEPHVKRTKSSNTTGKKAQEWECPQPVPTNCLSSSHPIFLGSAHNQYLWFMMSISPEKY
jgi:hypothetical protein